MVKSFEHQTLQSTQTRYCRHSNVILRWWSSEEDTRNGVPLTVIIIGRSLELAPLIELAEV